MRLAMSSQSNVEIGFVDTNVFIHALTNDPLSDECLAFLNALERGEQSAYLHTMVVHELTYAIPRYLKGITRLGIAEYVYSVLSWPGIVVDDDLLVEVIRTWARTTHGFVDVYLSVLARKHNVAIFTKNVRHLKELGAVVPDPLPHGELLST